MRSLSGVQRQILYVYIVAVGIFHIYTATVGSFEASALGAPVLIKLGFMPLTAHMFVFYYAIVSNITPPVALAAYAASSIAQSDSNRTGYTAMKLGCLAFLVPFAFCYDPGLLMLGSLSTNAWAVCSGIIAVFALGPFWVGYACSPLNWGQRALLAVAGVSVLTPYPTVICAGLVGVAGIWGISYMRGQRPLSQRLVSG